MRDLVRIGIPTALEQMALRFGVIMFLKIVSGLGNNVYAVTKLPLNTFALIFSSTSIRDYSFLTDGAIALGEKNENS